MRFGNIGNYSAKAALGEMWRNISGYYMPWRKIVRLTFLTQMCGIVLFFSVLISFICGVSFCGSIGSELANSSAWNRLGVWDVFGGNYQEFIGDSGTTQRILLKFVFFVFFTRTMFWSLLLILGLYCVKLLLFSSMVSRDRSLLPIALDVAINLIPWNSYQRMKAMDLPDRERRINFGKILNDLMNLQSFPGIEQDKSLVETKNLSFDYGGHWAVGKWLLEMAKRCLPKSPKTVENSEVLRNINLKINPSRFTSILGCNGSSKSTLLKAIINLFDDYSGEITWIGKDLREISQKSFYRNVAYIAQETSIQNKITVYDYVACGLFPSFSLFRFSYPKDHPLILENLEKMGLLQYRDKDINGLSGGEKQKAILARVLTQKTEVIILDEPTTYLDIKNQYLILNLLKKLQLEENKTIITILHDIRQAQRFSDDVILLDSGRIYASGGASEVITRENIEAVFGIPWGQ